jgi:hypothetical protein
MLIKSDAALARLLGLSPAAVCRAKSRGMPTHDLQAAQRWREQNLSPAHRKDRNPLKRNSGHRLGSGTGQALVDRVQALMELAAPTIGAPTFDALRPALQQAMRDVPEALRAGVVLSVPVMDELLRPVLDLVDNASPGGAAGQVDGEALSDDDARTMGAFWYHVACGEPVPVVLMS